MNSSYESTGEDLPGEEKKSDSDKMIKKRENVFSLIKKFPVIFTILSALIVLAVVYFWKDNQGRQQVAVMEKMAVEQISQNTQDMLKLMSKPLIWSIRGEMLRGNMEQVNIFTTDLVKEKNFQFIHIIGPGGDILVSTDKKMEGQTAIGMFDVDLTSSDSIIVKKNDKNNTLTLAAPVMGYDKRLATLVFNYVPEKFPDTADQPTP